MYLNFKIPSVYMKIHTISLNPKIFEPIRKYKSYNLIGK